MTGLIPASGLRMFERRTALAIRRCRFGQAGRSVPAARGVLGRATSRSLHRRSSSVEGVPSRSDHDDVENFANDQRSPPICASDQARVSEASPKGRKKKAAEAAFSTQYTLWVQRGGIGGSSSWPGVGRSMARPVVSSAGAGARVAGAGSVVTAGGFAAVVVRSARGTVMLKKAMPRITAAARVPSIQPAALLLRLSPTWRGGLVPGGEGNGSDMWALLRRLLEKETRQPAAEFRGAQCPWLQPQSNDSCQSRRACKSAPFRSQEGTHRRRQALSQQAESAAAAPMWSWQLFHYGDSRGARLDAWDDYQPT